MLDEMKKYFNNKGFRLEFERGCIYKIIENTRGMNNPIGTIIARVIIHKDYIVSMCGGRYESASEYFKEDFNIGN